MAKAGVALWSRKTQDKARDSSEAVSEHPAAAVNAAERPIEMVSQESKPSSVGQRKAFFEAMIRSNSDTYISARQPDSPGTSAPISTMQSKPSPCRLRENVFANNSADQEYNEVQLTFRMPKHSVSNSMPTSNLSTPQTSAAAPLPTSLLSQTQARISQPAQTEIIAALQLEMQQKERQWKADAARLQRKSQEVENLTRVVSELTQGRSKLVLGRTVQAERLARLQHEYERVLKIADLSRTVSKENMAKAAVAQRQLNNVEEDLRRQQRLVAYLKDHSGRLKLDNVELNERIRLLERLPMFKYGRESACMLEFTAYKIRETY